MHVFQLFIHNGTADFVTCLLDFQRFKSIPRCRALPKVVVNFHYRENPQLFRIFSFRNFFNSLLLQ